MRYIVKAHNKPIDVAMRLYGNSSDGLIKTIAYNPENNDVILERIDIMSEFQNGHKDVILKLPLTANRVVIESFSNTHGRRKIWKDDTFKAQVLGVYPLKTYTIDYGSGDREYLAFIENFVRELPNLQPSDRIIKSPSGTFKIVLFDEIVGYSGEVLNTPAMVGLKTGTIEVSKRRFMRMSQNQRIATLTHEYAHFYKNPLIGKSKDDEYGADMNGLTVYLARGYGESEYLNAFKKTFNGAKTEQNRARYELIKDFARKINSGQFFGKPYNI